MPDVRHGGLMALRLTVRPDQPENPPAMIETPPLWITSPATLVTAGQIVRIHGWVNVPTAISGSVDGLMVVDSLTGEETALRIDQDGRLARVYHVPHRARVGLALPDLRAHRAGQGPTWTT